MILAGKHLALIGCAALFCPSCGPLATAPSVDAASQDAIRAAVSEVSSDSLLATLEAIQVVRTADSPDLQAAESALVGFLESSGYTVQKSTSGGEGTAHDAMDTLVAERPGSSATLAPVFVMAHWDSVPAGPGMDDNGSGTAAVIEIARILSTRTLDRSVRFLLFGNEERGLVGSYAYAEDLEDAELPDFFVNFDMIGYTATTADALSLLLGQPRGDWIGAYALDWAAEALAAFDAATRAFAPGCKFVAMSLPVDFGDEPFIMTVGGSDQTPFSNRGVPGIVLTEAGFYGMERNPYYHSARDTLETLDLAFMAEVVKAALAAVCMEAGLRP